MGRNTNLLLLGAGAVIAYILYNKAKQVAALPGQAYNAAVNTTSDLLSAVFGPAVTTSSTYYVVTFPDGSKNAVPGNSVDAQGNFTWTGYPAGSQPAQDLQIMIGSDGSKYAVPGSPQQIF